MGDADVAHDMGPTNDELENLLDEALTEVDDEMDRLLSYVSHLNARTSIVTNKAMSFMSTWQKFRLCFTALNLFIIPIILSIGIAYGSAGWVIPGSMLQTGIEMFIMIAMSFSLSLGMPLYAFTLWTLFTEDEVEDFPFVNIYTLDNLEGPSMANLQVSLDTLRMFRTFSRARVIADISQMERDREEHQVPGDSEESEGFSTNSEETTSTVNNETIKFSQPKVIVLDSDDSLTEGDSDTSRSETEHKTLKSAKTPSRSILRTIHIVQEKEGNIVTFKKDFETNASETLISS